MATGAYADSSNLSLFAEVLGWPPRWPMVSTGLQQLLQRLVTEHQNVAKRADPLEGMPALSKAAPRAVSLDDSTQRPVCSQQPPEQVGQPPSM